MQRSRPAGAAPYESLITDGTLAERLGVLRELVARLCELEGPFAWNAWLHARAETHALRRATALAESSSAPGST